MSMDDEHNVYFWSNGKDRIDDAFYREKQVQGWRRAKREALINGHPELLPTLAKKIFEKRSKSVVEYEVP